MPSIEGEVGGRPLSLTVGDVAGQANGACWIRYGDTVLLVTVVASKNVREGISFFPLMVDYQEKSYAAGKIPGGFFKREGKLSDKQILGCRLIDRAFRPLFNKAIRNDIHIITTVLSTDHACYPPLLGIIGASSALNVSDIPFPEMVAAVEIGRINKEFIINPTLAQTEESDLEIVVAGTRWGVGMIEAGASEVEERVVIEAIQLAHEEIQKIILLQERLVEEVGPITKSEMIEEKIDIDLERRVRELATQKIEAVSRIAEKKEREAMMNKVVEEVTESLLGEALERKAEIGSICSQIEREVIRKTILDEKIRADGRRLNEIRPIECQVGVLPRVHGSAIFKRGQTQALVVATLGTTEDEQIVDDIEGRTSKRFMLHYYFPSFSVGEVKMLRAPDRREIGHGALAERGLSPLIPSEEEFPYTIRLVSDILESNGSTSMASACGGMLALMDAGVPVLDLCAGVAMGLVKEEERIAILSDISGLEDAIGDMDFKVVGTRKGVTAIQMDLKIREISFEILTQAFDQARQDRLFILQEMEKTLDRPREDLSPYAPRIIRMIILPEKIGSIIGPGGRTIRSIIEATDAKIDIKDDGRITIAAIDRRKGEEAREMIEYLTAEAEVGKIYSGKVMRVVKFGAFVEILPGKEGLVHISELAPYRVNRVEDVVREGDEIKVKVIEIDNQGRINLSHKQVLLSERRERG